MTLTISVLASILVIGALIASPDAYSTNDNDEPDECSCEKPDTLKIKFNAPVDGLFKIEIYKKLDDRNDPKKLPLQTFDDVPKDHVDGSPLVISAILFGKDKLESNTAFVVLNALEEVVAEMEIHTSCSKPLFVGKTDMDNGYLIEVLEGTKGGVPSIPIDEPLTCEDEKKKSTGSITVKKALTNDNGGTAEFEDFTITITNVETPETPFTIEIDPVLGMGVKDVPAGTYTLNEILPDPSKGTYTTVLIAGDTGCPSMLEEVFTIKKNKNLSCTIYNDDNFDASTGGPGGIIFTNESLQIKSGDSTMHDSCDSLEGGVPKFFDEITGEQILPCIEIIDASVIAIVDPELKNNLRTIVLFSVFEAELDASGSAVNAECNLEVIKPHEDLNNDPANGTPNLAVRLGCGNIDSGVLINVNYVMIDPGM